MVQIQRNIEEIMNLKGKELIDVYGGRPKGCQKKDEELEYCNYVKCIGDGSINSQRLYKRIPIRRRDPESILSYRPIEDADDLEMRIRAIVDWYRDMMPDYNIVLEFGAQALTDEEMDALIAEEERNTEYNSTLFEVEC